jgi:hypothetical protein
MGNTIKPIILTHEHLNDFIEKSDKNSGNSNVVVVTRKKMFIGNSNGIKLEAQHLPHTLLHFLYKKNMYCLYHLVNNPSASSIYIHSHWISSSFVECLPNAINL